MLRGLFLCVNASCEPADHRTPYGTVALGNERRRRRFPGGTGRTACANHFANAHSIALSERGAVDGGALPSHRATWSATSYVRGTVPPMSGNVLVLGAVARLAWAARSGLGGKGRSKKSHHAGWLATSEYVVTAAMIEWAVPRVSAIPAGLFRAWGLVSLLVTPFQAC